MKKTICFCILMAAVIFALWSNEKKGEVTKQEPTPLIIYTDSEVKQGVYQGTITFQGEEVDPWSYEGTIYILFDGERVRVTCGDAIESNFAERF